MNYEFAFLLYGLIRCLEQLKSPNNYSKKKLAFEMIIRISFDFVRIFCCRKLARHKFPPRILVERNISSSYQAIPIVRTLQIISKKFWGLFSLTFILVDLTKYTQFHGNFFSSSTISNWISWKVKNFGIWRLFTVKTLRFFSTLPR